MGLLSNILANNRLKYQEQQRLAVDRERLEIERMRAAEASLRLQNQLQAQADASRQRQTALQFQQYDIMKEMHQDMLANNQNEQAAAFRPVLERMQFNLAAGVATGHRVPEMGAVQAGRPATSAMSAVAQARSPRPQAAAAGGQAPAAEGAAQSAGEAAQSAARSASLADRSGSLPSRSVFSAAPPRAEVIPTQSTAEAPEETQQAVQETQAPAPQAKQVQPPPPTGADAPPQQVSADESAVPSSAPQAQSQSLVQQSAQAMRSGAEQMIRNVTPRPFDASPSGGIEPLSALGRPGVVAMPGEEQGITYQTSGQVNPVSLEETLEMNAQRRELAATDFEQTQEELFNALQQEAGIPIFVPSAEKGEPSQAGFSIGIETAAGEVTSIDQTVTPGEDGDPARVVTRQERRPVSRLTTSYLDEEKNPKLLRDAFRDVGLGKVKDMVDTLEQFGNKSLAAGELVDDMVRNQIVPEVKQLMGDLEVSGVMERLDNQTFQKNLFAADFEGETPDDINRFSEAATRLLTEPEPGGDKLYIMNAPTQRVITQMEDALGQVGAVSDQSLAVNSEKMRRALMGSLGDRELTPGDKERLIQTIRRHESQLFKQTQLPRTARGFEVRPPPRMVPELRNAWNETLKEWLTPKERRRALGEID